MSNSKKLFLKNCSFFENGTSNAERITACNLQRKFLISNLIFNWFKILFYAINSFKIRQNFLFRDKEIKI